MTLSKQERIDILKKSKETAIKAREKAKKARAIKQFKQELQKSKPKPKYEYETEDEDEQQRRNPGRHENLDRHPHHARHLAPHHGVEANPVGAHLGLRHAGHCAAT